MSEAHSTITNNPLVYAVVLTWNDTEMTRNCLKSLLENDYSNFKVILVDNGSDEPCGEILKKEFPEIELLVLPENKGFTGGANTGLRQGLEKGAKYVFFLNNDTILAPNVISNMVEVHENQPDCGMTSAMLLFPIEDNGEQEVQFYSSTVDQNVCLHYHHHLGDPLGDKEWPDVENKFVPACAILMRADALKKIGLFDETLGTNWEDYDLCLRFVTNDWKIITVGDARVVHLDSKTTGRQSPYITYYFTRNRLICMWRYSSFRGVVSNAIPILKSFYHQIRDYGFGNWSCHKAFIKAWFDFLIGRRGADRVLRSRSG